MSELSFPCGVLHKSTDLNPQTYMYLLNGVLILVHELLGVFTHNPMGDAVVNAALWTLPVEFSCYVLCFVGYKITKFGKKRFLLISVPILLVVFLYFAKFFPQQLSVVRAVVLFYIGVAFWVLRMTCCFIPLQVLFR